MGNEKGHMSGLQQCIISPPMSCFGRKPVVQKGMHVSILGLEFCPEAKTDHPTQALPLSPTLCNLRLPT